MTFGVAAIGYELGEPADVAEWAPAYTAGYDSVRDWGYQGFHRARDGVGLTDLAVAAGRDALDRVGLAADAVDLIAFAPTDLAEHLYWDAAAAVQARLGAHRADVVQVTAACSGGVVGFGMVAATLAIRPAYQVALLVSANRVCERYWNRMESTSSVAADGAAAAVLVRDHPARRWLATETMTDGRYADLFRLSVGGAARPFSADSGPVTPIGRPIDRLEAHFGRDIPAMAAFARLVRQNVRVVFERACSSAGIVPAQVGHLIHVGDNAKTIAAVAADLGIPADKTNARLAAVHGHLGSADQIFGLGCLTEAGALKPGEAVALTSVGGGMRWSCTLLRA